MIDPTHLKALLCSLNVIVDNPVSLSPPNHRFSIFVVDFIEGVLYLVIGSSIHGLMVCI
jgi:hypothetical protein